jgi:hypothetical protein
VDKYSNRPCHLLSIAYEVVVAIQNLFRAYHAHSQDISRPQLVDKYGDTFDSFCSLSAVARIELADE